MGGRGASSGMSDKGKPYGTEYHSVYQSGNIKFVIANEGATNVPKYISYYDKNNKHYKQIDLEHYHKVNGIKEKPHVHKGYEHNEKGDFTLSIKENKMVERVLKVWYNKHSK